MKLKSPKDGKRYNTDVANTQQLLRIIQSIPSPKAEPFKLWLAQVGAERIEETVDPELTIDRALASCAKKGYSPERKNKRRTRSLGTEYSTLSTTSGRRFEPAYQLQPSVFA